MFKYLAFDMDGTLLDSNKTMSPKSIEMIREFRQKGASIILISDRRLSGLTDYANQLYFEKDDFIICRNGLQIYNGKCELIKEHGYLSIKDIKDLAVYSNMNRITFFTENIDYSCVLRKKDKSLIKSFKNMLKNKERRNALNDTGIKKKTVYLDELRLIKDSKIEKARLICNDKTEISKHYSVYRVVENPEMTDVFNKCINKYSALEFLNSNGFIDNLDELIYFGDDTNDYECFTNLKHSVAMGNAHEMIKKYAWKITDDCDSDGIYIILKNLL